jgi:hypothetical protein
MITSCERLRRAQVPILETQYVFQSVHSLQIREEGVYMGFAAVSDTRESLDHQVHIWSWSVFKFTRNVRFPSQSFA